MNYELVENDVFSLNEEDYIIISIYEYENIKYYFTNKLISEEEPGKEFVIFKGLNDGLVIENDKKILNLILPFFNNDINHKIELLRANSKEGSEYE